MSDNERAIRDVIQTWIQASAAGDLDRVLALMSDDVVFLTPGRPPFGKEEFAAASRASAGLVRFEGTSEVLEVSIAGEMAYTRTRLNVAVTPTWGGEAKRMSGHTLSVFRKQPDGRWVLTRDANLLGPEPRKQGIQAAVPALPVRSVPRSITWYRDVLGFSANPFGPADDPVFASLHRDGVELMLQKLRGELAPKAPVSGPGMDVYLRVLDVRTLRESVETKVPDVGPIEEREYKCLEFSLTDPDGHVLVFGQSV